MNRNLKLIVDNSNSKEKEKYFFEKKELKIILDLYAKMVSEGSWKDYGLTISSKQVSFSVFKNAAENAMYKICKNFKPFNKNLKYLITDAKEKGARIEKISNWDSDKKIAPHFIFETTEDMNVSKTEIFGPLLPIITYNDISEPINIINSNDKPLALYYFGKDKKIKKKLIFETQSGGIVFNDTVIQFAIKSLPFGGVGASGMGQYHGKEGFKTFSQAKPVVFKGRINPLRLAYPPYGKTIHKLLERFFIK